MTQTIDFRLELLFLALVLGTIVAVVVILVSMARSKRSQAKWWSAVLGITWLIYLAVLITSASRAPQLIVPMGHSLCFDELCFTVVNVEAASQLDPATKPEHNGDVFDLVTIRTSNQARGRTQSERGLHAMLWTPQHTYSISQAGQAAWDGSHVNHSLAATIPAGQALLSTQVFEVPRETSQPGLALSNGITPGYLVIGETPLLHPPTILSLRASK